MLEWPRIIKLLVFYISVYLHFSKKKTREINIVYDLNINNLSLNEESEITCKPYL